MSQDEMWSGGRVDELEVNDVLTIKYGIVTHISDDYVQTVQCDDGETFKLRNLIERAGGANVGDAVVLRRTKLRNQVAWVGSRRKEV